MPKKKDNAIQANGKPKAKWYYDACTLDSSKKTFKEILNGRKTAIAFISHLAIGEAYGNSIDKGEEVATAFVGLINSLKKVESFQIIGNDVSHDLYKKVCIEYPRLSLTDALHLATAIEQKCCIFRTTDSDLCGLKNISAFGKECGISEFVVTQKNLS